MGTYTSSLKNDRNFFWSPFSHSHGCLLSPMRTTRSAGERSFISLAMSFRMREPGSLKPIAFTFFLSLSHVSSASSNLMMEGASALATLNTMCIIIAAELRAVQQKRLRIWRRRSNVLRAKRQHHRLRQNSHIF